MTINQSIATNFESILTKLGCFNFEHIKESTEQSIINFETKLSHSTIKLSVTYSNAKRWLYLPTVKYLERNQPALAHVSNGGMICVTDHEGEMFDAQNRNSLFEFAVKKALTILTKSLTDLQNGNRHDLYEELEGYNQTVLNTNESVILSVNPQDHKNLCALTHKTTQKHKIHPKYIIHEIVSKDEIGSRSKLYTAVSVKTIVLRDIREFIIPNTFQEFTEDWWEQQIAKLPVEEQLKIKQLDSFNIVLLQIPTPKIPTYLVISYDFTGQPLIKFRNFKVQGIQRAWKDYLLNRVGVKDIKKDKTVVIAGCGSVGSRVAELLAQSNIGRLVLIDTDVMKTDNIMRHYLGLQEVGQYKVIGLKNRLEQNIPNIKIQREVSDIITWLNKQSVQDLMQIDALVLATGHAPSELEVCNILFNKGGDIQVVSGWLEPYGLGGHVLSFNSNQDGCLNCLYHDEQGDSSIHIRTRLFEYDPNIILSKNISGCVGAFTAYGAIDATKTAIFIAESIVENKFGLFSWISDTRKPSDYLLKETDYYAKVVSHSHFLKTPIENIKVLGCPCCSA